MRHAVRHQDLPGSAAQTPSWLTSASSPATSLLTCQVLAWSLLATSSIWLETSIPTKTESDTSLRSHPCLCELQVPTTVRAARKDGPTRAHSAQGRASTFGPEVARATRVGPSPQDTRFCRGSGRTAASQPPRVARRAGDPARRVGRRSEGTAAVPAALRAPTVERQQPRKVTASAQSPQQPQATAARRAFQAPKIAIRPGIMIMAQMILLRLACTQGTLPKT